MSEKSFSLPWIPMQEAMQGTSSHEARIADPAGYNSGVRSAVSFYKVARVRELPFNLAALFNDNGWVALERSCQDSNTELHPNCHGFMTTAIALARRDNTPGDFAAAFEGRPDGPTIVQRELEGVAA